LRLEGLDQVLLGAGLELLVLLERVGGGVGASQNYRYALELLVLLESRTEHVAIGRLRLDADHDQVRIFRLGHRHALLAVGRRRGDESAGDDGVRQTLREGFVGVDEKDSFRHAEPGQGRSKAYGRGTRGVNETP